MDPPLPRSGTMDGARGPSTSRCRSQSPCWLLTADPATGRCRGSARAATVPTVVSDSRAARSSSRRAACGVRPRAISTPSARWTTDNSCEPGGDPMRLAGPQMPVEHHVGAQAQPKTQVRGQVDQRPGGGRVEDHRAAGFRVGPDRSGTRRDVATAAAAPSSVPTVTSSASTRIVTDNPRADGTATRNASCNAPSRSARSVARLVQRSGQPGKVRGQPGGQVHPTAPGAGPAAARCCPCPCRADRAARCRGSATDRGPPTYPVRLTLPPPGLSRTRFRGIDPQSPAATKPNAV